MEKMLKSLDECEFCSKLRPLSSHLYEMAEFCHFLDNSVQYQDDDGKREVKTTVIGDWLKLASQLEKVQIDTWKFAGDDGLYCETAAYRYDSDSKHFSKYSTALTRFIFLSNALEETYRFVTHIFDRLVIQTNIIKKQRLKKPSMKSTVLVDAIEPYNLPSNFHHIVGNLVFFFDHYQNVFSPQLSGMTKASTTDVSYGLHLLRNLRNHVAHGVFPLVDNHDYSSDPPLRLLTNLLFHACRAGTVYIQILIGRHNEGFQSNEYESIQNAHGKEFDYFIQNCTNEYSGSLHMNGKFSFFNWIECAR